MYKILILSNTVSGLKSFRFEVINNLKNKGYEITIYCPESEKDYRVKSFSDIGVKYKKLSFNRRKKNPFEDLSLFFKYVKILKKEKPSIVLTYTIKPNIYGGLACHLLKIPYLVNITGLGAAFEKENFLKKMVIFLYKISMKSCSCLYVQNEKGFEEFSKYLDKKIIKLLPGSGVNLEKFELTNYPKQSNKIIINYIGRVMRMKGIEEFLYCVEFIKKKYSNVVFRIIGSFDDENYRQDVVKYNELGLLEYIGYQKDIIPFIKDSHLIINASYSEGMSNVLLEHAAMGRPAIASNIPGCKEIVEDGKSGFLFEVKNKYDLVDKVEKFILLEYDEKAKMGKLARKIVEEKFDRNIVVNEYENKIKEILSK